MRLAGKTKTEIQEGDLTPMIDMTFQLIAFFMVLINFSQSEQEETVQLPDSSLAKPAEQPFEHPVIIHMDKENQAILHGLRVPIGGLDPYLTKEIRSLEIRYGVGPESATVVVRAHRLSHAGEVQQLIKKCQEFGFENFALRAEENVMSTQYTVPRN